MKKEEKIAEINAFLKSNKVSLMKKAETKL